MKHKIKNKEGLSLVLWWIGLTFSIGFLFPFVTNLFSSRNTTATTLLTAEPQSNQGDIEPIETIQESQQNSPNTAASSPFPVPVSGPAEIQRKYNTPSPANTNNPASNSATDPANNPRNPYIKLMQAQKAARERNLAVRNKDRVYDEGDLDKALESIHSGKVNPGQAEKRNLYFEKLSNQLKELQGQNQAQKPTDQEKLDPAGVATDKGDRFGSPGQDHEDSEFEDTDLEDADLEDDFEEEGEFVGDTLDPGLEIDEDPARLPEDDFEDLPLGNQ